MFITSYKCHKSVLDKTWGILLGINLSSPTGSARRAKELIDFLKKKCVFRVMETHTMRLRGWPWMSVQKLKEKRCACPMHPYGVRGEAWVSEIQGNIKLHLKKFHFSLHELALPHRGVPVWEGGGSDRKARRGGAHQEEGLEEEACKAEGEDDEGMNARLTLVLKMYVKYIQYVFNHSRHPLYLPIYTPVTSRWNSFKVYWYERLKFYTCIYKPIWEMLSQGK